MERKADAFVTKLAHSLATTAVSNAQPHPPRAAITARFEQSVQSLPTSKLRTYLLANLSTYAPQLLHLYSQQLPSPPPAPVAGLFTRDAFDVALSSLRGDARSDIVRCESLLACSNCPSTVLSTYFRQQLSLLPTTPLSLTALHRALSLQDGTAALLASVAACLEWAESQLTQHMSPCEWLSSTIDRLTTLFTMHARALVDPSTVSRNAVLSQLCRLLLLGVVWRSEESNLLAYTAHVTRTLAVWEVPPSAVNVDAQLLLLCQWCALLHSDKHDQPASAAVSSSAWLATTRLPAILAAVLPGITRSLPLGSANTRSIAFVRLAILHSILPSSASDLLTSHLSSVASLPLPSALLSLWPSDNRKGRAVVLSMQQWVTRASEVVSERTLLQQLMALGAVGSEVDGAATSDAEGSTTSTHRAVATAGQEEAEEEEGLDGYGWFDDRKGDTHDALDGQLHSLIADLTDNSRSTDDEEYVDSAVSGMMQQAGEDQPIAAEQQAAAEQSEQANEEAEDEQSVPTAATSTVQLQPDNVDDQEDATVDSTVAEDVSTNNPLSPPSVRREKKRAKADKRTVRISPRHTRSGMKL